MAILLDIDDSFRGSVVLFAVEREARAFRRHLPVHNQLIHVGVTGIGKKRAARYLESLLARGAIPNRIIVAGFAGALREGVSVADVIVASELVDEFGGRWDTNWPDKRLGRVLTSDQMIGEPARKLELGTKHSADCVDMESSAVAEACRRHGIPFGCVRVVSDEVNRPLSKRLIGLVESGRMSVPRLVWGIARNPKMAVELIRLARHTRRAANALAEKLKSLLALPEQSM